MDLDGQWESEKATLMDLLANTQALLKTAHESAARERDEQAEQSRLMELRLSSQLKLLRAENASLKQEIDRMNSAQGLDGVSLKSFMLKEIDKVERRSRERETELLGLVESSQHETQVHKSQLESRAKSFSNERERLLKELETARQDTKSVHLHYNVQIQTLKADHDRGLTDLRKAYEETKTARMELQALQETEASRRMQMQDAFIKEKEDLMTQIANLQKAIKRKEKIIAGISSASDSEKRAELTPLKAQIEALGTDKLALTQQLRMSAALYVKKEKNLLEQVEMWKKLAEQVKVRPASVHAIPEADQSRLLSVISALELDGRNIRDKLRDVETYTEKVNSIFVLSEQTESQMRVEKEGRFDQLLALMTSPNATPQLERMESKLTQVAKAYETALQETYEKAAAAFERTSEALQDQVLLIKSQHQDLASLMAENQQLTAQLETLQSETKAGLESKTAEELMLVKLELDQAKKMMETYLESIQSLEVLIEDNTEDGEIRCDISVEMERFNQEVTRMAEENAILTEALQTAKEEFAAGTNKLREMLEWKVKESAALRAKLSQEKKNSVELIQTVSEKIEDAVSTVAEANASMKVELKQFLRSLPEVAQLQQAWTEAQTTVFNSLKSDIEQKSTLIKQLRSQWKEEVASLKAASTDHKSLVTQMEAAVKAVSSLSEALSNGLENLSELTENLAGSHGSRLRDAKVVRLQAEIDSLSNQLSVKQQEFQEELLIVKNKAETDVKSVKQIEATLTAEINALRAKLKEVKALSQ